MSFNDALGYESFTIPIATVLAYAGQTVPDGFLKCDGSSYTSSAYPELFSEIKYKYGGSAGNFNTPDLVTQPYIIGATLATAGDVNIGGVTSTTDINIVEANLPSLSQGNFSVTDFTVTGQITNGGGAASTGGGTNVEQDEFVSQNVFKTDTGTTNAAQFSVSGTIPVNNLNDPLIPAGDVIPSTPTMPSLQMIYIIKAKYRPTPTSAPASPFSYINSYYLRTTDGSFNQNISGFIQPNSIFYPL